MPIVTPTELIRGIQRDMTRIITWQRLAQGTVTECEGILTDLEHEIELLPLDRVALRRRAELMRDTRRRRRKAKDELETLTEICRTLEKLGAVRAVDEAVRAAEQADRNRDKRQYKPRVRPEAAAVNRKKEG
jgi:hypothetical protein